jgi:hypothetical protein
VGSKIRDKYLKRDGVVLDTARQYAHPQAKPVYNYLVRWQDGQVNAISEGALRRGVAVEGIADEL